jgi:hypothetical protein
LCEVSKLPVTAEPEILLEKEELDASLYFIINVRFFNLLSQSKNDFYDTTYQAVIRIEQETRICLEYVRNSYLFNPQRISC